jgi:hypothetical protein
MQQRQPRLGDILDDYCPRERRVTNHAVVAMVGIDVKQTRCTTCDAEHDFKHAKVPRQRKKSDSPAGLYAQVLAGGPKKVTHDPPVAMATAPAVVTASLAAIDNQRDDQGSEPDDALLGGERSLFDDDMLEGSDQDEIVEPEDELRPAPVEEGPVHRRLIRAQLPRIEGQPPPARQAPDFTIRQPAPAGRVNRFRPRNQPRSAGGGGGGQFQGPSNRSNQNNGSGPMRSGSQGHGSQGHGSQGNGSQGNSSQGNGGGRPPMVSRLAKHQGPGRKRSK